MVVYVSKGLIIFKFRLNFFNLNPSKSSEIGQLISVAPYLESTEINGIGIL